MEPRPRSRASSRGEAELASGSSSVISLAIRFSSASGRACPAMDDAISSPVRLSRRDASRPRGIASSIAAGAAGLRLSGGPYLSRVASGLISSVLLGPVEGLVGEPIEVLGAAGGGELADAG